MEIEFSQHALDQLKIRTRIKRFMVTSTVRNPDEVSRSFRGRQLYRKRIGAEILEVIVVKEHNKLVIITEYLLEQ